MEFERKLSSHLLRVAETISPQRVQSLRGSTLVVGATPAEAALETEVVSNAFQQLSFGEEVIDADTDQ